MVYVDQLRATLRTRAWPYTLGCHMLADTLDELHAFAADLGMRREWFQDVARPHYDLTATRQKLALARGAVLVRSRDEFGRIIRQLREDRSRSGWS